MIERIRQMQKLKKKRFTDESVERLQRQLERDEFRILEAVYQPTEKDKRIKQEGLNE